MKKLFSVLLLGLRSSFLNADDKPAGNTTPATPPPPPLPKKIHPETLFHGRAIPDGYLVLRVGRHTRGLNNRKERLAAIPVTCERSAHRQSLDGYGRESLLQRLGQRQSDALLYRGRGEDQAPISSLPSQVGHGLRQRRSGV